MPSKKHEKPLQGNKSSGGIIEVHGHRGCRGLFPENTLPSFQAAIEAEADTLEMDLLMTRDGEFVVHHDFFLNNTLCTYADGTPISDIILIKDLSLAEIKEIDCGRKRDPRFPSQKSVPGTKIPTLDEVFDLVHGKNVQLNLEIKRDALHPEYTFPAEILAEKAVEVARKKGLDCKSYYSSFDFDVLHAIRKINSQIVLQFIVDETLEGIIEASKELNATRIAPKHSLLKTKEDVAKLKNAGFQVASWTVNRLNRWKQLIEMEVDGIITDYPKDLVQFIKTHEGSW